jgi:hypothetical protein
MVKVNVSGPELAKWEGKANEYFTAHAGKAADVDIGRLGYFKFEVTCSDSTAFNNLKAQIDKITSLEEV